MGKIRNPVLHYSRLSEVVQSQKFVGADLCVCPLGRATTQGRPYIDTSVESD